MKLTIISHTEHYKADDGTIIGWGPTIGELNHLIKDFDEITHVAMLLSGKPPPSSLAYTSSNIKFVALPSLGGKTITSKLKLIIAIPKVIYIVAKQLKKTDVFQLRTPTGIGVFLIPFLTLFIKKKGWYKYAGNWNQENPPLGYRLQRWMLKNQKRTVTINGKWKDQHKQCITFENPCLGLNDFEEGKKLVKNKEYLAPFSFCFVGRLERAKGVERIINAFGLLSEKEKAQVKEVVFVGNGEEAPYFSKLACDCGVPIKFLGFLSRNEVFTLYKNSHFFLLPSTASEGFPKVIAEAMNFGCIPIVSNVSSIGQYINNKNGYIVSPTNSQKLQEIVSAICAEKEQVFKEKAKLGATVSEKFTFHNYNNRLQKEIINKQTN